MKFRNGVNIFWSIYLLFFAIGLPLVLHYAGDHHQNDYQMVHTSAGEAFVLLGLGTVLWFIVFAYYVKRFLIHLLLKKNTIEIAPDGEPTYILIDGQAVKRNARTKVLAVMGLLLLIALAAGILVYTYSNESRGYGWRYLYFWHPYLIIPGSFIFYFGLLLGAKGVFFKYLGKAVKP